MKKRHAVSIAVIAAALVSAFVVAQPTGSPGLQKVVHGLTLTGSGTNPAPLDFALCGSNQIWKMGSSGGSGWGCQADSTGTGTVTSVGSGSGLSGGPITTSGNLAIDPTYTQRRVSGTCTGANAVQTINQDGTVACSTGTTGTVTSVGSGSGISGGPITSTGNIAIDPTYTQRRVSGTCTTPNAVVSVNQDGTVSCSSGTGTVTGTGSTNHEAKWTSSTAVGSGWASDDGTTWGIASIFTITEASGNVGVGGTFTGSGAATFQGTLTFGQIIGTAVTPTTITGTVNDYAPTSLSTATDLYIASSSGVPTITGLTGGTADRRITIHNVDASNNLLIACNNASSAAGNRITGPWGSVNLTLTAGTNSNVTLEYNGTSSRWRVIGFVSDTWPAMTVTGAFVGSSTGSFGGALNMNSHLIDNVTDPVSAQDALTLNYFNNHTTAGTGSGSNGFITIWTGASTIAKGALQDNGTYTTQNETVEGTTVDNTWTGFMNNYAFPASKHTVILDVTDPSSLLTGIVAPSENYRTILIRNSSANCIPVYDDNTNSTITNRIKLELPSGGGGDLCPGGTLTCNYDPNLGTVTPGRWSCAITWAWQSPTDVVVNGALSVSGTSSLSGQLDMNGQSIIHVAQVSTTIQSPSSISGSVVDYAGCGSFECRLTLSADATLHGIMGSGIGTNTTTIHFINLSAHTLTVTNESVTETTATNRILTGTTQSLSILQDGSFDAVYDGVTQRWRVKNQQSQVIQGLGIHMLGGISSDSSGITSGAGISAANGFAAGGPSAINNFVNAPSGGEGQYTGTHVEGVDDWMNIPSGLTGGPLPMGHGYFFATAGTAVGTTSHTPVSGRPGLISITDGTSSGALSELVSISDAVNFSDGKWSYDAVLAWPTLSGSAAAGIGYATVVGFFDTSSVISPGGQVDGCFILYDRENVSPSPAPNPSKVNNLECWCAANSVRTAYLMAGVGSGSSGDGGFTLGSAAVVAGTYMNLEVDVDASIPEADFKVNGTKMCQIKTNIPTGTARATGYGILHINTATSSFTSEQVDIDFTKWAVDLTSVRTP